MLDDTYDSTRLSIWVRFSRKFFQNWRGAAGSGSLTRVDLKTLVIPLRLTHYPPPCRLHQLPPFCLNLQEKSTNVLLRINPLLPCPCPLIPMDQRRVQWGSEGALWFVTHLKRCSNSNYLFVCFFRRKWVANAAALARMSGAGTENTKTDASCNEVQRCVSVGYFTIPVTYMYSKMVIYSI